MCNLRKKSDFKLCFCYSCVCVFDVQVLMCVCLRAETSFDLVLVKILLVIVQEFAVLGYVGISSH